MLLNSFYKSSNLVLVNYYIISYGSLTGLNINLGNKYCNK